MQGPGPDGIRVVGQLNPGTGIGDPVVDGQFVLIPSPLRLAVPEGELGALGPGAEGERRGDQAGLRPAPVLLIEEGVIVAVRGRGLVEAAGILDPVGGPGDELLGPDVGIVGRGSPRPGTVEILGVGDGHPGGGRGRLTPAESGKEGDNQQGDGTEGDKSFHCLSPGALILTDGVPRQLTVIVSRRPQAGGTIFVLRLQREATRGLPVTFSI